MDHRLPALFVGHGSPMVAIQDDAYNQTLAAYARTLPRPRAILAVSAHWEAGAPLRVTGTTGRLQTIHDFGGFPDELYGIQYPAQAEPTLAAEVVSALVSSGHEAILDPARGLDHGAWVPLRFMYPEADVPVVGLSLPIPRSAESLLSVGAALAPLRARGVLVLGSGGLVHNLRRVDFRNKYAPVEPWAREFDTWVATQLASAPEALATYATAPHARAAVPTSEHFDPALVVVGARTAGEKVSTIFEGFHHATLSMRCFAVS
jgi:4,5-DOPA dioxygenase extradiol